MMNKFLLLQLLLNLSCLLSAQNRIDTLINCLRTPNSTRVLVVAHRGDWRNAPENSIQAFTNCIQMGVDMIELDLKKTKDNQLIVLHDQTLDRTTNGTGRPEDYTLTELKHFYLKNGIGRITSHKIPTLREVLEVTKGKILINIDKGYDYFKDVYELLQETQTVGQVVIKSSIPYTQVLADNGDILTKVIYMPVVDLNSPDAENIINEYQEMAPFAIECVFSEFTPTVARLMDKIKKSGMKIWLNSLWPSLNAMHDDDKAVEQGQKDETWGWLVKQGASLIQTDRPFDLINYLKQMNKH